MSKVISNYFFKLLFLKFILFLSFLFIIPTSSISKISLNEKIELLHSSLQKISKNQIANISDIVIVKDVIETIYDEKKMIRMIVGKDKWSKTTKQEKEDLASVFQEYISYNYVKGFKKISNFKFELRDTQKIGKSYKILKTYLIIPKEEKVEINYLFHKKNNEWKIFDVLLAGTISEIATKKSEFSKIINDGGIKKLIGTMKEKINSLNKN